MLNDVRNIEIQGANLDSITGFPVFLDNTKSINLGLLYGRNGSGKSTLARAFRFVSGIPTENIDSVSILDELNSEIILTEDEKKSIFVFDEDFVNKEVFLQEDALGAVVMLGEKAKLTEEIEKIKTELANDEKERDQKKSAYEEYCNITNPKSPKYYEEKMKKVLQKNNGWAERKRVIDIRRTNAPVNDLTYKEFIHLSPAKDRDALYADYLNELENYKKALDGESKIAVSVPTVEDAFIHYDTSVGDKLLISPIEHPELNDREKYLLKLVEEGQGEDLRITANEFENPELSVCPKCFQTLSAEYKADLVMSIQQVLTKEVEMHQNELKRAMLPDLQLNLDSFYKLSSCEACLNLIVFINTQIKNNNMLLQEKYDYPYNPINKELIPIVEPVNSLIDGLRQLEKEREAYNTQVTDCSHIKDELNRINNEIAYWDVIELSQQHDKCVIEMNKAKEGYLAAQNVFDLKRGKLDELQAKQDDIDIAIDVINDGLKYIFFSERRMTISIEDGKYRLLSNGVPVKPKDVSVGERNIIGLCYFFTRAIEGKKKTTAYSAEYLLVIDDPISSYDFENKIGILSYLKLKLGEFLLGNPDTKVLIMTHDLFTAIDLEKIASELKTSFTSKYGGRREFNSYSKELKNHTLEPFYNKRNEYTELMKVVYEYANHKTAEQEPYIGNIIRQVLEAFSTFEYKKSIEDVSTDESILSLLGSDELEKYFRNLMYRIVVNEGSHRYDQTRNMEVDFFRLISDTEKQRTAKDVLCFMKLLNRPHIEAHLGKAAALVIDQWCNDLA